MMAVVPAAVFALGHSVGQSSQLTYWHYHPKASLSERWKKLQYNLIPFHYGRNFSLSPSWKIISVNIKHCIYNIIIVVLCLVFHYVILVLIVLFMVIIYSAMKAPPFKLLFSTNLITWMSNLLQCRHASLDIWGTRDALIFRWVTTCAALL